MVSLPGRWSGQLCQLSGWDGIERLRGQRGHLKPFDCSRPKLAADCHGEGEMREGHTGSSMRSVIWGLPKNLSQKSWFMQFEVECKAMNLTAKEQS